jgi:glycosyltransferase involved in cell wall biosynthesis
MTEAAPGREAADAPVPCATSVITHVDPRRSEIGGMQAVLRDYEANVPDGTRFRFIATYTARGRACSGLLFALALLRIGFTPRKAQGSIHLHVAKHGSVWRKAIIAGICRRRAVRVAATVHASQLEDDVCRHGFAWKRLLARCEAIGALSHKAVKDLSTLDPTARVAHVPNRVPVAPTLVPAPNTKRVLFAAAVCRRKGVDVLMEAWPTVLEHHADAELLLAGPAADVTPPRLPGVRVLGAVPPQHVRALIADVDVAVLPSRSEGLPVFVLEAMAAGRPVVATDIGDLAELVGDGGRVVPPGCVTSLASALSALLADPVSAADRGELGRRRVAQRYDVVDLDVDLRRLHRRLARQVA